MGCAGSKENETAKQIRKPKSWKHSEPITMAQLVRMRDEFWDTAPHYGGRKENSLCWLLCIDATSNNNSEFPQVGSGEGRMYADLTPKRPLAWEKERKKSRKEIKGELMPHPVIEIWDALQAAAESDISLAQAIVDSAGIIVQAPDLTICYDERGAKYELPKYVLSEPTNLIRES